MFGGLVVRVVGSLCGCCFADWVWVYCCVGLGVGICDGFGC